jgi:hypothetical protein
MSAVRCLDAFTKGHQEQLRGGFSSKTVCRLNTIPLLTKDVFSAASKSMFPHKALSIAGYSQVHWTLAVFDTSEWKL